MPSPRETATLGGGCFWCLEAAFERLRGVERVVSGYAGGRTPDPTYEDVCTGETGHAEVVQVTFDPAALPYRALLEVFFTIHDPTTPDRQGADVGTQYRSTILHRTDAQRTTAEDLIRELAEKKAYPNPIVTEVAPLARFHPAEDYHQGYYRQNPQQGYCRAVINPKLAKLRREWGGRLKGE